MNPEELFKIKDSSAEKLPEKNIQENKSSDQKSEDVDIKPKKKETTIDDIMSFLKDNKIQADPKTIQNYYNQIVENKNTINEYNQTLNELEKTKSESSSKEKGGTNIPDSIKNKLAELNTLKREKEDEIKSTINNIFNENKSEENENITLETKNSFLNLVMQDSPKEEENITQTTTEKQEEPKENTPVVPEKIEENVENAPVVPEKIEENVENTPVVPEKVEEPKEETLISPENEIPAEDNAFEEIKTESSEEIPEPFSDLKKEENIEKESEIPSESSNKEDGFAKISENMQKGFESVLNAIKGISSNTKEPAQTEQREESPKPQKQENAMQENRPKKSQKNYIDEYRETLRSNSPLKGYVGIKGMQLKANNIGSYV
jgi:hypothetical protein